MKKKVRRFAIRNHPGIFLVPLFTALSMAITLWMALTNHPRVTWMALVSMASIFTWLIVHTRVRAAYRTLKHHRARRRLPGGPEKAQRDD